MCAARCPTHLLPLDEAFAHDLVDGGFHEPGSDGFAVAVAIGIIGDGVEVRCYIVHEFLKLVLYGLGALRFGTDVPGEVFEREECSMRAAMPEVGLGSTQNSFARIPGAKLQADALVGFNTKWDPSNNLTMSFDVSWSHTTNDNGGNQSWFEADYPGSSLANAAFALGPKNLPTFTGLPNFANTSQLRTGYHDFEGQDFDDKIYEGDYRLKVSFDSGILKNIQAGANYSQRTKGLVTVKTPDDIIALQQGLQLPSNLYSPVTGASNLLGTGMFTTPFPGFSVNAVNAYLLSPVAIAQSANPAATQALFASNGGGFGVVPQLGSSGTVKEETAGAFVEASFGDKKWSGNLGVRVTHTKTLSSGVNQDISGVTYTAAGYPQISLTPPVPHTQSGSYAVFLPNANFKYAASNSAMLQLAVAKTLTRPTLSDLFLEENINARPASAGGQTISQGNPGLKPMEAWNYDAALTWHQNQGNFLSAALFAKSISNLEYQGGTTETIAGLQWQVSEPQNLLSEKLIGYELSGQYAFTGLPAPFDGLGFQANYSYSRPSGGSSAAQGYTQTNNVTYNLIGFYEKGPIQFRLAYNWRNAHISQHNLNGTYIDNLMVAAYGEVDASVQYNLNKYFAVFAQALNLNDEHVLQYWNYTDRVSDYEGYGRRFGLGARMKF